MNDDVYKPCCLTVAGSDSGGNAGVQADLRTFHAYGVHGCTVFAALTAQNPFGVTAVHEVPLDFVVAQLEAVFSAYRVRSLKTGMLSSPEIIDCVARQFACKPDIKKVVDPVMVATSGARLISDSAIVALQEKLLPLAYLVTPNLPEASVLLGREITSRDQVPDAARDLSRRFGCAVLVKGGHAVESTALVRGAVSAQAEDVLYVEGRIESFSLPTLAHPISTHGTGCSLAAALTAELAFGHSLVQAVAGAKAYVHDAIAGSYWVGPNCGVLGFAPKGVSV